MMIYLCFLLSNPSYLRHWISRWIEEKLRLNHDMDVGSFYLSNDDDS